MCDKSIFYLFPFRLYAHFQAFRHRTHEISKKIGGKCFPLCKDAVPKSCKLLKHLLDSFCLRTPQMFSKGFKDIAREKSIGLAYSIYQE